MTKELAATVFKTEGADGKTLKIYYGSMMFHNDSYIWIISSGFVVYINDIVNIANKFIQQHS